MVRLHLCVWWCICWQPAPAENNRNGILWQIAIMCNHKVPPKVSLFLVSDLCHWHQHLCYARLASQSSSWTPGLSLQEITNTCRTATYQYISWQPKTHHHPTTARMQLIMSRQREITLASCSLWSDLHIQYGTHLEFVVCKLKCIASYIGSLPCTTIPRHAHFTSPRIPALTKCTRLKYSNKSFWMGVPGEKRHLYRILSCKH